MNPKYYTILLLVPSLFYLFGCNSSPYNISETDRPDTVTVGTGDTSSLSLSQLNAKYPKQNYLIRSAPQFTLQLNAGFNYGLAELNTNYQTVYQANELITGENFGVRKGFGISAMGKIPVAWNGSLRATFLGSYNYFFNNTLSSLVAADGSVKYSVMSLGLGLENSFTPSYRIKPYIGAAVLFDIISGSASYTDTLYQVINYKIKPSFRIGLNVSTGIEYLLTKQLGLNLGINITCANLLLKSSQTSDDPYNIPLRDKRVENTIPFSGYKQFLYTTFNLGVNYYFGIKEKGFHI